MKPNQLVHELQQIFSSHADPQRAQDQQRYMKSTMPFWGIAVPEVRKLATTIFKSHIPQTNVEYREELNNIFTHATHREEWYAGCEYAKKFKRFMIEDNVDLYIDIIRLTQWWDIVDEIAALDIGTAIFKSPNLSSFVNTWIEDENMWIRRTALLTQLKYKEQTDFNLLKKLILHVAHEKEFFIRKAIGWALRQYSYTDPDAVQEFIGAHENILSPLSIKEGMKAIMRPRS